MTDSCSSKVIGREIAAGSNMTIDGTATAIGITTETAVAVDVDTTDDSR